MQNWTLPFQSSTSSADGAEELPEIVVTRQPRRKKMDDAGAPLDLSGVVALPSPLTSTPSSIGIPSTELPRYIAAWITDGEIAQHSSATLMNRRGTLDRVLWLLDHKQITWCDTDALRAFLEHATNGHKEAGGRWGNPRMIKPASPGTVATYYRHLVTFFTWMVEQKYLASSPMAALNPPVDRPDQVNPFTDTELDVLLASAKKSLYPLRDYAIALLLLDTGIRVSEVCKLIMGDIDVVGKRAEVEGKGGKRRSVSFGTRTSRAIWAYLQEFPRDQFSPVFLSERGPFTRRGLQRLVERLGEQLAPDQQRKYGAPKSRRPERITIVKSHPHRFRHTFAVNYLLAGGDPFSLQTILGHTDPKMTQKYVNFARADVERQHRMHSPVERHFRREK